MASGRGTGDRGVCRLLPGAGGGCLLPHEPHHELAPLFGVSPATVCRVIQRLGPLLALEPALRPVDTTDRLWIVDGTLIPVRDRKVGASSRNYRFSANVQIIIDADTRLVAAARPAPGNKADAHVWRSSSLPAQCQGATVFGDGAYIGTDLTVPHRKRPGRPLLDGEEADNAEHRRVRVRVRVRLRLRTGRYPAHARGGTPSWRAVSGA